MRGLSCVVVLGFLVAAGRAQAHGQFPLPINVLPDLAGTGSVAVATFGLLVPSSETGRFTWVCEEMAGGNLTSAVTWNRTAAGTVVAGGRLGAFRFSTNLCGVTRPSGIADMDRVRAVAVHPTAPVVAVSVGSGDIRLSRDDGMTFTTTSLVQPSALGNTLLVEGDPGSPRIIALWRMLLDGHAELQVSDDGGQTSRSVVLSDTNAGVWELLAVDHARTDQVYVRENGDSVDRLLRVSLVDGTSTVLRQAADDLTLGVSRDGQVVATGGIQGGLRVSDDAGETFVDRPTLHQVRGVAFGEGRRMFVAADNWNDGFAFGVSADLGLTWTGMGRFVDLAGVHTCADAGPGCAADGGACISGVGNDVVAQCGGYWPALVALFGIGADGGTAATDPPGRAGCGHCAQADVSWVVLLMALGRWRRRSV